MAKDPEQRDLFAGALELLILHSLRLKPMHGYALAKHIKQVSDNLLQIEEGSLYPALQRMLKEGLLESKAGISAKGRPTRLLAAQAGGALAGGLLLNWGAVWAFLAATLVCGVCAGAALVSPLGRPGAPR